MVSAVKMRQEDVQKKQRFTKNLYLFCSEIVYKIAKPFFLCVCGNNIYYKVFRAGNGEEQGDREETEPSNTFPSSTLSAEPKINFM